MRGGWKDSLQKALGGRYEVILPRMPNSLNARYAEWKIMFCKLVPFLKGRPILVGHSLGGIFLAKYLAENRFPRKVRATFLVAAPHGNDRGRKTNRSLVDFILPRSLARFREQGGKIFIYHSKDDSQVPFTHLEKYRRNLPDATTRIFGNRGHFSQEKLPELVKDIRRL
jgi:predicted alpha/beta hydrolase family esterase